MPFPDASDTIFHSAVCVALCLVRMCQQAIVGVGLLTARSYLLLCCPDLHQVHKVRHWVEPILLTKVQLFSWLNVGSRQPAVSKGLANLAHDQFFNSSSSLLSFHQKTHVRQIVPSQCLAQPMAMPLAVVRYWVEQAVFIMGQTSRCCMVCLMPQSQVSASFENPHLNMFTLDRPTCVRNRLSAFQVIQRFSAPAGRCSSALMLRCTLASRGSSHSLHNSMRAAFAVVLMGSEHLIKLFRDFRNGTIPRCPLSGCLWSIVCRVRSVWLVTAGASTSRAWESDISDCKSCYHHPPRRTTNKVLHLDHTSNIYFSVPIFELGYKLHFKH